MKSEDFINAYNESRNGANQFFRHSLVRRFAYSDGVQQCAVAGMYWAIDIFATELPAILKAHDEHMGCVTIKVKHTKATMVMTGSGDVQRWMRKIDYTDMPDGEWLFFVTNDGDGVFRCILPSEY